MKTSMKNIVLMVLSLILIMETILPMKVSAVTSTAITTYVTVNEYLQQLVTVAKLPVDLTVEQPYYAVALSGGLVKEGEFTDLEKLLTKQETALLTNRTDEIMNGTDYDTEKYQQVVKKKRISDLTQIDKDKQEAVVKVFINGIMVGDSNGKYTHSRTFSGSKKLTQSEEKTIVSRLSSTSMRKKISPDGQLIRTTKLPKNYKSYSYILASFPNAFYEKKFKYQTTKYGDKPVEMVDYASPKKLITTKKFNGYNYQDVLDAYLDVWTKKIEANLKTRLNVDYRTVDSVWINRLAKTYYVYDQEDLAYMNKRQVDDIKEYVAKIKKNKVIVKGSVSVESSTMYLASGYYIRSYIKFKVDSATNMKVNTQDLIYGPSTAIPNLKKDKWYTYYIDTALGTPCFNSDGSDLSVYDY